MTTPTDRAMPRSPLKDTLPLLWLALAALIAMAALMMAEGF